MSMKVELRIRTCCCCGLTVATILVAIYALIFYLLLLGLASWGVTKIGDEPNHYIQCLGKAQSDDEGTKVGDVHFKDVGNYFCSLGLYTEELKFADLSRRIVLIIDIVLYVLMVISAILVLVALCTEIHWLLLPFIGFLSLDVIRGLISVILIFCWSYESLVRIAVGIFFLGIQIFHISIILVIIGKFQRMYDKKRGIDFKIEQTHEKSIIADGSQMYPTLPSQYAYSNSPQARREGYYQPNYYNTYSGSHENRGYRGDYNGTAPRNGGVYGQYAGHHSQYRQETQIAR